MQGNCAGRVKEPAADTGDEGGFANSTPVILYGGGEGAAAGYNLIDVNGTLYTSVTYAFTIVNGMKKGITDVNGETQALPPPPPRRDA